MSGSERQINVARTNHSVLDNEFDSMRDRFENEMQRVEQEMQRLRHEFEGHKPSKPYTSTTDSRGQTHGDRYYGRTNSNFI
jgi:GH25 family lysozyme M1 (1,4-beta-N-acetylmuramidase)